MKRMILEWGLIVSTGMLLTLSVLWAGSYFVDRPSTYVRVSVVDDLRKDLHILVGDGDVWLFDQPSVGRSGDVSPWVANVRDIIAPKVRNSGCRTAPGFDLRYCQFIDGYVVWSLKLSLLYPVALALGVVIVFRQRLKALRKRIEPPA